MEDNQNIEEQVTETVESPADETTQAPAQNPNKTVLLGAISYENYADYENFLNKLDINQSIFVLITAAQAAQARGAINLDEAELITKAIRTIKKGQAPANAKVDVPAQSEE